MCATRGSRERKRVPTSQHRHIDVDFTVLLWTSLTRSHGIGSRNLIPATAATYQGTYDGAIFSPTLRESLILFKVKYAKHATVGHLN